MNDSELRERVRAQYGDGTASAAALSRVQSGESFQHELDITHGMLLTQRWGAVYRHAKETVGAPPRRKGEPGTLRFKAGGNPVDYTGHINFGRAPDGTWRLVSPGQPGVNLVRIPVAFDAKREGSGIEYHSREPAQKRQLMDLREAAEAGACTFLLVHCVAARRAFMIHRPEQLSTLLGGKGIQLVEKGSGTQLLPGVEWSMATGWPWYVLLPLVFPAVFRGT